MTGSIYLSTSLIKHTSIDIHPISEAVALCSIIISGVPWCCWTGSLSRPFQPFMFCIIIEISKIFKPSISRMWSSSSKHYQNQHVHEKISSRESFFCAFLQNTFWATHLSLKEILWLDLVAGIGSCLQSFSDNNMSADSEEGKCHKV